MRGIQETENNVKRILDESDEKLKKGEITKEENEQLHFYYEFEFCC